MLNVELIDKNNVEKVKEFISSKMSTDADNVVKLWFTEKMAR